MLVLIDILSSTFYRVSLAPTDLGVDTVYIDWYQCKIDYFDYKNICFLII